MNYKEIIQRSKKSGACREALKWAQGVSSDEEFWAGLKVCWMKWLARKPWIDAAVQKRLVAYNSVSINEALAGGTAIVPEVQMRLAEDSDDWVRIALARNTAIVPEAQMILVKDKDDWVRKNLASIIDDIRG